jgi:hypothetical protein
MSAPRKCPDELRERAGRMCNLRRQATVSGVAPDLGDAVRLLQWRAHQGASCRSCRGLFLPSHNVGTSASSLFETVGSSWMG